MDIFERSFVCFSGNLSNNSPDIVSIDSRKTLDTRVSLMRPVKVASKSIYETSTVSLFVHLPMPMYVTSHAHSHTCTLTCFAYSSSWILKEKMDCSSLVSSMWLQDSYKAISNHLKTHLHKLINCDQTGFLKGRFIGENIHLIDSVINYTVKKFLDFYFSLTLRRLLTH